jgi:hypothetical protein
MRLNESVVESAALEWFENLSYQVGHDFRPIPAVRPPEELMANFTENSAPFYARITGNLRQSHTLATLRDTLLPQLLGGRFSGVSLDTESESAP